MCFKGNFGSIVTIMPNMVIKDNIIFIWNIRANQNIGKIYNVHNSAFKNIQEHVSPLPGIFFPRVFWCLLFQFGKEKKNRYNPRQR